MLTILPKHDEPFDHAIATREGWDVFHCDALPDGERQLQRVDAPEDGERPFANDRDAWEHVVARAPGPPCTAMQWRRSTTPSAC